MPHSVKYNARNCIKQCLEMKEFVDDKEMKNKRSSMNYYYESWKAQDIVNWIINLDKDRYSKYYDLLNNMNHEGIDGTRLGDLKANDLHGLSINTDKDLRILCEHIKSLNCYRYLLIVFIVLVY